VVGVGFAGAAFVLSGIVAVAASLVGVPSAPQTFLTSVSPVAGFALGVWVVFRYWELEPKAAKPSVPPED
jgi:hypothetical protein